MEEQGNNNYAQYPIASSGSDLIKDLRGERVVDQSYMGKNQNQKNSRKLEWFEKPNQPEANQLPYERFNNGLANRAKDYNQAQNGYQNQHFLPENDNNIDEEFESFDYSYGYYDHLGNYHSSQMMNFSEDEEEEEDFRIMGARESQYSHQFSGYQNANKRLLNKNSYSNRNYYQGKNTYYKDLGENEREQQISKFTSSNGSTSGSLREKEKSRIIFVGNLNYRSERDDIWEYFQHCGNIVDIRIAHNPSGSVKK